MCCLVCSFGSLRYFCLTLFDLFSYLSNFLFSSDVVVNYRHTSVSLSPMLLWLLFHTTSHVVSHTQVKCS